MSREVHVRFCESLGVRFPRATHPYIPMRRGFIYLFAILDWATRKVLAWSISISLTTGFCIAALEAAIAEYGCPEIVNTDQGSQFTSNAFVDAFEGHPHAAEYGRQGLLA